MKPALWSFGYGLLLTGLAALASSAIAVWGFHKLYYLAAMLPVFMVFYLLLAWLVYLRRTAFLSGSRPDRRRYPVFGHHENELTGDLPEERVSGAELIDVRDENDPVRSRTSVREKQPDIPLRNAIAALLWSACQLALLATILYRSFGVGARYF